MLKLEGLHKSFGNTAAVRDVSLTAAAGRVLGLVGENGAGKSTILKMLAGLVAPDRGAIALNGRPLALGSPRTARAQGVQCAFQELTTLPGLTIAENLALGETVSPLTLLSQSRQRASASEKMRAFGLALDVAQRVDALPLGLRYQIEVVKCLSGDPQVLLLDESTAALAGHEVDWLEGWVSRLKAQNRIILFVSHRWDEIERFCDDVAILRNGQLVHTCRSAEITHDAAVQHMCGHALGEIFPSPRARADGTELIRLDAVSTARLKEVSCRVQAGEILGLAGLAGQGQEELLRLLFGIDKIAGGHMAIAGRKAHNLTPRRARRLGIGLVPLDRKGEGLFLRKSVAFNLLIGSRRTRGRVPGFPSSGREKALVGELMAGLSIRPAEPTLDVARLSGGNQQKVLYQRTAAERPKVLLLADVTRGVDIATKRELYYGIRKAADAGTAVILYSTDNEELARLCDRVLVWRRGEIVASLDGRFSSADIVSAATGVEIDAP